LPLKAEIGRMIQISVHIKNAVSLRAFRQNREVSVLLPEQSESDGLAEPIHLRFLGQQGRRTAADSEKKFNPLDRRSVYSPNRTGGLYKVNVPDPSESLV
jgi:hypothetical protein